MVADVGCHLLVLAAIFISPPPVLSAILTHRIQGPKLYALRLYMCDANMQSLVVKPCTEHSSLSLKS